MRLHTQDTLRAFLIDAAVCKKCTLRVSQRTEPSQGTGQHVPQNAFALEGGRGSLKTGSDQLAAAYVTFTPPKSEDRRTSGGAGCAMTPRALH